MAIIMKSGLSRLREKIATNQELAAQFEQQLSTLGSKTDARPGAFAGPAHDRKRLELFFSLLQLRMPKRIGHFKAFTTGTGR